MKVNLLPYQLAQKAGPNWRAVFTIAGVVLLAAVTLIFYVALQAQVASFKADIASTEKELANYASAVERKSLLDSLQAAYTEKSAFIGQLAGEGIKWNSVMDEIRHIVPATVVLESVTSNTEGLVNIDGRAGSLQAIAQFVVNIQAAQTVTDPDVKSIGWNTDLGVYEWKMTCKTKQVVSTGG